ncbi:ankyrin repeat domain-containing protein [Pseudoxanthomonas sp. Root630]|uniref:ankyrin repeat domain-containing protein n=1 Tax=Pseudoxanthomonas sp. Root630 TaxID=1736574 RepID=UPI000702F59A|nr:ankyrin repeat domain-containing protein [Pseudoxanthomonas sp. Root630]KRA47579.1 hypothetical protein ASD72_20130 [Pseudoxanthomonas sp. Root630]
MNALREAVERNDGEAVDALLRQDTGLVRDVFYMSDQPTTCPKCGSRTAFTEGTGSDGPHQVHFCGPCDYPFLVVEDPDFEEPMDLDAPTSHALHDAALRADLPALRTAMRAEGADLDALNERGMTALHLALAGAYTYDHAVDAWEVSQPHLAAFHELLLAGASPDAENRHGFSVWDQAMMMGLTDEGGPTTTAQLFAALDPMRAAYEAVKAGDVDALRQVIARVPDGLEGRLPDPDGRGPTLLHVAAGNGDAASVAALLRYPTMTLRETLNASYCGMTPLYMAASSGSVDAVTALLRAGAETETDTVAHPLHVAAEQARPDVLAALLENGAQPNAPDANGATALHVAARKGNVAHVRLLADAGADPEARDALGRTPREVAAGHAAVLSAMDEGNAAWNARERAAVERVAAHASVAPTESMEATLARLEAENAQLRAEHTRLKASLKGLLALERSLGLTVSEPSPTARKPTP